MVQYINTQEWTLCRRQSSLWNDNRQTFVFKEYCTNFTLEVEELGVTNRLWIHDFGPIICIYASIDSRTCHKIFLVNILFTEFGLTDI